MVVIAVVISGKVEGGERKTRKRNYRRKANIGKGKFNYSRKG